MHPQAIVLLDIRFYMPEWWLDAIPMMHRPILKDASQYL